MKLYIYVTYFLIFFSLVIFPLKAADQKLAEQLYALTLKDNTLDILKQLNKKSSIIKDSFTKAFEGKSFESWESIQINWLENNNCFVHKDKAIKNIKDFKKCFINILIIEADAYIITELSKKHEFLLVSSYASNFTDAEIKELIKFFESQDGKNFLRVILDATKNLDSQEINNNTIFGAIEKTFTPDILKSLKASGEFVKKPIFEKWHAMTEFDNKQLDNWVEDILTSEEEVKIVRQKALKRAYNEYFTSISKNIKPNCFDAINESFIVK